MTIELILIILLAVIVVILIAVALNMAKTIEQLRQLISKLEAQQPKSKRC